VTDLDLPPQRCQDDDRKVRSGALTFLDRMLLPTMALSVIVFGAVALWSFVSQPAVSVFDPLDYSPQTIERVTDDGTVTVPSVNGFDPPTIQLGETVPVRGLLTNTADHPVSTAGTVVWQEEPPGRRFVILVDVPGVIAPGVTQLKFENPIPPVVEEYVRDNGATAFSINGRVQVLEPGGVDATWSTATFRVVP